MFVSITQLSEKLNLKISFIRQLVFRKQIPYLKIGKLVRFKESEIVDWLKQKEVAGNSREEYKATETKKEGL